MVGARLDNSDNYTPVPGDSAELRADMRQAYEQGRKDERAARKRHPLLMGLTFAAALAGVVLLALAAINGSFTRAGGVVDQNLSTAAARAEPQVRDAADAAATRAEDSLKDAGQSVKDKIDGKPG